MGLRNSKHDEARTTTAYYPVSSKPKRKTPIKIDHREFVKAWLSSSSVNEVAKKFDITNSNAHAKANYLRKIGVKLPHMERKRDYNSVDELNALISKHTKGN